jgi:hypothetical protein
VNAVYCNKCREACAYVCVYECVCVCACAYERARTDGMLTGLTTLLQKAGAIPSTDHGLPKIAIREADGCDEGPDVE